MTDAGQRPRDPLFEIADAVQNENRAFSDRNAQVTKEKFPHFPDGEVFFRLTRPLMGDPVTCSFKQFAHCYFLSKYTIKIET